MYHLMEIKIYSNIYILMSIKRMKTSVSTKVWQKKQLQAASQLSIVSRSLKRLGVGKPEIKIVDTISAPTNISTTLSGLTYGVNPSQGLTNLTRLGRNITVKRYQFRMTIYPNPSATSPGEVRMIWIWQKFPNQSLQTPATTLQTVTNIHSPFQYDTTGYKVLMDKTYSFSISDFQNKYLNVKLPIKDVPVEFTEADTTGNSANLVKGYLRGFIMYNGFAGSVPSYDLYQRVYFQDA